jgi:DNA repair exonuclease SbcCD ATPase subunit
LSKEIDHNMPSIKLDKDQVEAFKGTRTKSTIPTSSVVEPSVQTSSSTTTQTKNTSSSALSKFSTFLIYSLMAGAAYWGYQQNINTTALLNSSENRIADLERQLSATGEEMGESAVEMKVRLETLGKTSDKLWIEMDKLWASAWRKNQSQIKSLENKNKSLNNLSSTQRKTITSTLASIKEINDKQVAAEYSVDAIKEQLKSSRKLTEEIKKLSLELSAIESNSQRRDKQQISLASRVTKLSEQNNQLRSQIKSLQTKLAKAIKSIPAKTAPPPVSPSINQ